MLTTSRPAPPGPAPASPPAPAAVARAVARPSARAALAAPLALAGAAVLGTATLAAWDPHTHHVPLCPLHAATGLWCPLCGGLRTVNDLVHGQLAAAVSDDVLVVAGLPLLLWWWVRWVAHARAGGTGTPAVTWGPLGRRAAVALLVLVVVAFTVLRNLPVGRALAP